MAGPSCQKGTPSSQKRKAPKRRDQKKRPRTSNQDKPLGPQAHTPWTVRKAQNWTFNDWRLQLGLTAARRGVEGGPAAWTRLGLMSRLLLAFPPDNIPRTLNNILFKAEAGEVWPLAGLAGLWQFGCPARALAAGEGGALGG